MVEVRRVGGNEWQELRDVRLEALADTPDAFGSTYEREREFDEHQWSETINELAWFIAWNGTNQVGLVAGKPSDTSRRGVISMWVRDTCRGQGVAEALVEAVAGWARADGADEIRLVVSDGNDRARRFYERIGFRPTGRRIPLPRDPSIQDDELGFKLSP